MADSAFITANIVDGASVNGNISEGVTIQTNVTTGTNVTANVVTGGKGDKGEKGDIGLTGATGPQGLQGVQGPTGSIGLTGPKGDTGNTGATGAKGDKGDTGDTGSQGIQGPIGLTGAKGDTGNTGSTGPKGDTGSQGIQGIQGIKGDKGDTGDTGPAGADGEGLPIGGLDGQALLKQSDTDLDYAWETLPTGVTDHGLLSGLADDDHTQYLNNTRGDARYNTKAEITTALSGKAATSHTHTASQVTDFASVVSSNIDVAANTAARHTHSNSSVLNATTASFLTADETKLDGIATGATANSTDATLLDRANHTGSQATSTITGLDTALATKLTDPMNTIGDIIYEGASSVPARLAAVATGNSLISGGVSTAPAWGKIGLTTHVSGTLPIANGGTGRATSTTAYGLIAAGTTATGAHQTLATGTTGMILKSNGASALPTFQTGAKADVGLGNVDNTSDATKNSAAATLTNKIIDGSQLVNQTVTSSKLSTGLAKATVATQESVAVSTYSDLTTTTDTVTVTVGANGIAIVMISSYISIGTSNSAALVSFAVSGANTISASDINAFEYQAYTANSESQLGTSITLIGLTAGSTTFKMKYRVSSGTASFKNRNISVLPL